MNISSKIAVAIVWTGAAAAPAASAAEATPSPAAKGDVARGRYLAIVGGCNDCHTAGYAPSGGRVPETQWLQGDGNVGFRGPWGTTYAPNLRKVAASKSEREWVDYLKHLETRPPMPWFTLRQWTDTDMRALHRFIRALGPPGEAVTAYVPPDGTPAGAVIQWPSPPK